MSFWQGKATLMLWLAAQLAVVATFGTIEWSMRHFMILAEHLNMCFPAFMQLYADLHDDHYFFIAPVVLIALSLAAARLLRTRATWVPAVELLVALLHCIGLNIAQTLPHHALCGNSI